MLKSGTTALALIVIFLIGSMAYAQSEGIHLGRGIKGGVGLSDVAYHERATGIRTAYSFGGIINYQQNPWFTFQMELLLAFKGYTLNDVLIVYRGIHSTDTGRADAEIILGYLELPILAKLQLPLTGKYRPYALGGGFLGLSIYDKTRLSEGSVAVDVDLENAETVDLGAVIGVGIDIKAGSGWVFLEARYDSSFMPAIRNEDQKSQALFFQFGYWW